MARRRRGAVLVVAGTVVVAAAVGGGLWYAHASTPDGAAAAAGTPSAAPTSAASSSPAPSSAALPTEVAEPTEGQVVATDPPVQTGGGSVQVVVTYSSWDAPAGVAAEDGKSGAVDVDGFVSGVVENGGTCRVTLTNGGVTVTGQIAGQADATTTVCPEISVSDPRLTPGTWQATLSYSSPSSHGTSKAVPVQVTSR